jgi:hypothetical protein
VPRTAAGLAGPLGEAANGIDRTQPLDVQQIADGGQIELSPDV